MAAGQHTERRLTLADRVDALLFAFAGLAAVWLGYLLIKEGVHAGWRLLLLVVFWVLFTYLVLPRLHRILTTIYVPGYFIGRARTSDGMLGDPVNLAWLGREEQIHRVMQRAGWTRADDLSLRSGRRIVTSTLTRRSYPRAPVSPLLLFDRQQDFAYQQEVAGSPSKRHHVRFWRCPDGWLLPGGYRVDWLAAGTYDRRVGLSLFTFQITHKIEANTDIERDFIVRTVRAGEPVSQLKVIENFASGYHSRNGGGDLIETDGDLPILDLQAVEASAPVAVIPTDSRDRKPAQIVFGGAVVTVQGILTALSALLVSVIPERSLVLMPGFSPGESEGLSVLAIRIIVATILGGVAAIEIIVGLTVLSGRPGVRLFTMLISVASIVYAFASALTGTEEISLTVNLPSITLNILVLLSLSSHRAREYTVRRRQRLLERCQLRILARTAS